MGKTQKKIKIQHWHIVAVMLMIYDVIAVNGAYALALWVRFDCRFSAIDLQYLEAWIEYIPLRTIVTLVVFLCMNMYKRIWRFLGINELLPMAYAVILAGVVNLFGITFLLQRMPISYYMLGFVLEFVAVIGIRFSYRVLVTERNRTHGKNTVNVMIIGAGSAGQMLMREINRSSELDMRVKCFIDDNVNKKSRYIEGVPVVGTRDDIMVMAEKYKIQQIIFAIPSTSVERRREILRICNETGCEVKTVPGIYQLVDGDVKVSQLRPISMEDLLGREPIRTDLASVTGYVEGKRILVTGGGGSIGSELCRQLAASRPAHLIIFDVYENNAYDIEQELRHDYPNLKLTVLIGSVRDSRRINQVFETYKPQIVYHAAAHKHVPLMEGSPCEAIKNNVFGTYKTALAAIRNHCDRFVLISTDKAVNPTNIMGASKRMCEKIIQSMDMIQRNGTYHLIEYTGHGENEEDVALREVAAPDEHRTEFVAVRFGNVLGSNGSVIPLFQKQIEHGGPVTVTHPDIIRYFMTIPEAVSLVLQAGAYAKGGEIFVLDMGESVKIDSLARNLIKMSGHKPDVDIKIEYTGLRPGEKLYEEKLMAEEGLQKTENKLIHIAKPVDFEYQAFLDGLQKLQHKANDNEEDLHDIVKELVPTYIGEHA
ncbi:MAG: polysaccharide biosynthesis protein [Clostridium sp.]|nr:polysaccharide biosynthesis protein [Clostridium sp.]